MAVHKVPLTVGFRKDKTVGYITIDPEIEAIMLQGGMFVLAPSVVKKYLRDDEIIEITLLPLPASEGG